MTPLCPICGEPAASVVERAVGGVITVNAFCPAEHIWTTKWLKEAA